MQQELVAPARPLGLRPAARNHRWGAGGVAPAPSV